MPAAKKHPSTRARANRASTASTLSAPAAGPIPSLPDRAEGWSQSTLLWWADLWRSPMSSEYHESDRHQVFVLAMLMDDFFTADSPSMRSKISAEIRQHRTAFGMTPYDRRRLEWQIEATEDAKDRGRSRREKRATPAGSPKPDPRRGLHAV